jgi:hypothetical protein
VRFGDASYDRDAEPVSTRLAFACLLEAVNGAKIVSSERGRCPRRLDDDHELVGYVNQSDIAGFARYQAL